MLSGVFLYQSLNRSWYTDLDYCSYRLPDLELGLWAGVTGRLGILTPPWHLILPLIYPEVRVCPILKFVFPTGLMRLMTVRYLCYFMQCKTIFDIILFLHYLSNTVNIFVYSFLGVMQLFRGSLKFIMWQPIVQAFGITWKQKWSKCHLMLNATKQYLNYLYFVWQSNNY
jgi:hypothetical protein